MTEPTDDELDRVLCNQWPAFSMQATLVRVWVRAAMRDALAKWGTQQPVPASAAEFALRALVAAGHVTQERVDQAMALPGAPAQPVAAPLTDEQMYEECRTAGTQLLDLSKLWADNRIHVYQFVNEAEKIVTDVARRVEAAHGIKGGQHGTE